MVCLPSEALVVDRAPREKFMARIKNLKENVQLTSSTVQLSSDYGTYFKVHQLVE